MLTIDYEARTMGSFVEKKQSSVTFHYRNADPVFGLFQGSSSSLAFLDVLSYTDDIQRSQGMSSDAGKYAGEFTD